MHDYIIWINSKRFNFFCNIKYKHSISISEQAGGNIVSKKKGDRLTMIYINYWMGSKDEIAAKFVMIFSEITKK